MPKRGSSIGTPIRGAGVARTPVITMLAVRAPAVRTVAGTSARGPSAPAAPDSSSRQPARRTLHDVVVAPSDGSPPLTLDELLTGWLSSLGASLEPDAFDEFGDYAKHVERMCRAQQAAEHLCRALDRRISDYVRDERSSPAPRRSRPTLARPD
jgi:hypothetical protein